MSSEVQMPLGFRFDPAYWELIVYYVMVKNFDLQPPIDIPEINNLYEHHPKNLQGGYVSENERYYFTKRVLVDDRSGRVKRSVEGEGHWKSTSRDTEIRNGENKKVGYMRTYTFEDIGVKKSSNWLMQEFRDLHAENSPDRYVLCKIHRGQR